MRGVRISFVLAALGVAGVAAATQHANNAKGFNANGVYQTNGLDNISAFNGNLVLTLPIGQAYSIGGGLTYQLRLYGNGNVWDAEERYDLDDETNGDCSKPPHTEQVPCVQAYPDRRANAGVGFTLSLGRLFAPDEQTSDSPWWIYEGPDGSEHHFFPELTESTSDGDANVFYTRDGTYLRMKVNGNRRTIEFPTGEVHTFMPADGVPHSPTEGGYLLAPWLVEKIGNRFAPNVIDVTYERENGRIVRCILSDGYRTHTIHYALLTFESGIEDMFSSEDPPPINQRMLVSDVELAAFEGTRAHYVFNYEQGNLLRPDWHTIPTEYVAQYAVTQSLKSVLLPDGTSFVFDYITDSLSGKNGLPWRMTLPTGGRIAWEWGFYQYPVWTGVLPTIQRPLGVTERRLYDRDGSLLGTWTYSPELDAHFKNDPPPRQLKVTITDPLQNKTENYFDISVLDPSSIDYGLPYTPLTPDGSGRFLSQRFIPAATLAAARSTFVRYERDAGAGYAFDRKNSRLVKSRTMYNDDANVYVDTDNTEYIGYGNYREVTTSGSGLQRRLTTTEFNPLTPSSPSDTSTPPVSAVWIPGTYRSRTVTEGEKTLTSEYHFDATTGFLRRTRAIKDTVSGGRGTADVITVFTPDSRGNVTREEIYGGDGANMSTANLDLISLSLSVRASRIDHEYASGSLRRSQFYDASNAPVSFYSADGEVDQNTGLVTETRDSAAVRTCFKYDQMGRLTWAKPTARAWSKYVYPDFATTTEIHAEEYLPGATCDSPVGSRIGRSRYVVDGLGRVDEEWVEMQGNLESRRETVYNALGWTMQVSELGRGSTLPWTIFTRDAFGRVLTATAPDASVTTYTYTGVRSKTRTSSISTSSPGAADTPVTTTEDFDLGGRLIRVTEKSGPTTASSPIGANVITEYSYDPAGRLTGVTMNKGGTSVQQRAFDYDGRGFLRWESHPESGVTSYAYDARGNVTSKTQAAANSPFDLKYSYDAAGRLWKVEGRNPFYGEPGQAEFRIVKEFTFATANAPPDLRNGKLLTASRYNYDRYWPEPIYKISDAYQYNDEGGRRTDRTTTVTRIESGYSSDLKSVAMSVSYNELDMPVTVKYPMCSNCGVPPVDPNRQLMVRTYDHRRLTSLGRPGSQYFVQNATYWPNGMRNLLPHGNGITDKQVVGSMPRPTEISFGRYDRCVRPRFVTQPASVTGGSPVQLFVSVDGTGPFEYEWWNQTTGQPAGTGQTITVNPTVTTEYYVTVTGACGIEQSHVAKVAVGECAAPSTGTLTPVLQPDRSWILRASPTARTGRTFAWRRMPSTAVIGTNDELAVGAHAERTTYGFTVTDTCGSETSYITIEVPLAITKTDLVATAVTSTQISVRWPAVSGATRYVLERRSGAVWQGIASLTSPSYDDTVVANRSYAYRVHAVGPDNVESDYSNSDVATTRSFTAAGAGTAITAVPTNEMLAAVNSVRSAAGWPGLTWDTVLAPNDVVPAPGTVVLARHVTSCRARMNEALQALGVPVLPYLDPDLTSGGLKAVHINQVQQRAQ